MNTFLESLKHTDQPLIIFVSGTWNFTENCLSLLWTVKIFDNRFRNESKLLSMPVVGSLEVKVAVEAVVAWIEDILAAVDILFQDQWTDSFCMRKIRLVQHVQNAIFDFIEAFLVTLLHTLRLNLVLILCLFVWTEVSWLSNFVIWSFPKDHFLWDQ